MRVGRRLRIGISDCKPPRQSTFKKNARAPSRSHMPMQLGQKRIGGVFVPKNRPTRLAWATRPQKAYLNVAFCGNSYQNVSVPGRRFCTFRHEREK